MNNLQYNSLRLKMVIPVEFGTYTIYLWGKPFSPVLSYPQSTVEIQSADLYRYYLHHEKKLQTMKQVHGNHVIGNLLESYAEEPEADAIFSFRESFALAVKTADCIPLLFFNKKQPAFGVIHSGWRGLLGDIFSETLEKLKVLYPDSFNDFYFIVGPHINTLSYETSDDVFSRFNPHYSIPGAMPSKRYLNMAGILNDKMKSWKIQTDNVKWMNENTYNSDQYFSHRSGDVGRNFNIITFTKSNQSE